MLATIPLLLGAFVGGGAAAAGSDILLPKPSGPYNVTVRTSELIDHSRLENSPNAPASARRKPRRVMVSMFSPVTEDTEACQSAYMLPGVAQVERTYWNNASAVTNDTDRFLADFNRFKLHACSVDVTHGAPKHIDSDDAGASKPQTFPLLFFSPGYGASRFYYSVLAQYIAASGFAVLTIDHPYSIDAIQFPDGSVLTSDPNPPIEDILYYVNTTGVRVADASFLADQLGSNATFRSLIYPRGTCHADANRIGIFGHSLGGAVAADLLISDSRFVGGVNYDGGFYGKFVNSTGTKLPFALWFDEALHARNNTPPSTGFEEAYDKMYGFKRNPRLIGARHLTFGDPKLLADTYPFNPSAFANSNISGLRVIEILSRYTRDFFRLALEGKGPGLMKGPNPQYPEVDFIP